MSRSLGLRRDAGDGAQTGTDLERHLTCRADRRHSAAGWLKADNAGQARTMVRFYDSRSSESPLSSTDLATRVDGDCGWTCQWRDLATPAGAVYFELRCGLEPPAAGTALAWFDDLALIEWEPWQAADAPLKIPAPNNYRYLQVRRAGTGAGAGVVAYSLTSYARAVPTGTSGQDAPQPRVGLSCHPNPFNPRTTVDFVLPGDGRRGAGQRGCPRPARPARRGPLQGTACAAGNGTDSAGTAGTTAAGPSRRASTSAGPGSAIGPRR